MNVALHGMEAAAGVRYHLTGSKPGTTMSDCPVMIRYADDLLALCHSREQAEQVKQRLAEWLAPRGLVFNDDKTQITHLDLGVDFLGFTIRRYPNGKLLTKPSNDALRRRRARPVVCPVAGYVEHSVVGLGFSWPQAVSPVTRST